MVADAKTFSGKIQYALYWEDLAKDHDVHLHIINTREICLIFSNRIELM